MVLLWVVWMQALGFAQGSIATLIIWVVGTLLLAVTSIVAAALLSFGMAHAFLSMANGGSLDLGDLFVFAPWRFGGLLLTMRMLWAAAVLGAVTMLTVPLLQGALGIVGVLLGVDPNLMQLALQPLKLLQWYINVRMMWAVFVWVDRNGTGVSSIGPIDSIRASLAMTNRKFWGTFWMILVIQLMGFAVFIPILKWVTIPLTLLWVAVVYSRIVYGNHE